MDLELGRGVESGALELLGELAASQRPVALDRAMEDAHRALLAGRSRPKSASRLRDQRTIVGANSGSDPAGVLGRDQVDRLAHHPGAQQRALLGAGAVDVGGGQTTGAGPEGELRRPRFLGLDRPGGTGDVGGAGECDGPGERLRRAPQARQPGHGPPIA